jgi:hypothetical protein
MLVSFKFIHRTSLSTFRVDILYYSQYFAIVFIVRSKICINSLTYKDIAFDLNLPLEIYWACFP